MARASLTALPSGSVDSPSSFSTIVFTHARRLVATLSATTPASAGDSPSCSNRSSISSFSMSGMAAISSSSSLIAACWTCVSDLPDRYSPAPIDRAPAKASAAPAITTILLFAVPPATPDTTPSGTSRPSRLPNMNWRMRLRAAIRSFSAKSRDASNVRRFSVELAGALRRQSDVSAPARLERRVSPGGRVGRQVSAGG